MATQNPQIVPIAFKSQQLPFFFGGSQVPTSFIDLTVPQSPKKKQKITHYYKKKPEVIDLVNDSDSSSDDEPIMFKSTNTHSGFSLLLVSYHFLNIFAASSELFTDCRDKLISSNEHASSNTKWNKSSSSTNNIDSIILG
jgi:hypothetical protein